MRCSGPSSIAAGQSNRFPLDGDDGDDVIIVPSVSDEEAKGLFAQGWKTLKPYLRLTKQPR